MLSTSGSKIEQKVGQMILAQAFGRFRSTSGAEFVSLRNLVAHHHVGGFKVYHGYSLGTILLLSHLESSNDKAAFLIASDLEEGLGQQIADAPRFPPMAALGATGDPELARQEGRLIATEALRLGISMIFGPLLDLYSPLDTYFGVRCISADPLITASLCAEFIHGVHDAGGLTAVKYFPGQGRQVFLPDGSTRIDASYQQLREQDWFPFRTAIIEAHTDAVMVGFGAFPSLDSSPWNSDAGTVPAALSKSVITEVLRKELGFNGLVVTDALNLPFLRRRHTTRELARMAVTAGADILVALSTPQDASDAAAGILDALEMGLVTEVQIDQAVERILNAKRSITVQRLGTVALSEYPASVGTDETVQLIERIATQSVCLLKEPADGFPILKRPISLSAIVIGSCRAREQIRADQWQPWHAAQRVEEVEILPFWVDPEQGHSDILRQAGADDHILVILLEGTDTCITSLRRLIPELLSLGKKPILILPIAPRIARALSPMGWASVWIADARQASRLAALAVVLGQVQPNGNLHF